MTPAGMPSARCAAGAGLTSAVIAVTAAFVAPINTPHADASANKIAHWLDVHRTAVLVSNSLFAVAFIALGLTFVAALYAFFRETAPDRGLATAIMFAGGVAEATLVGLLIVLGLASAWLAGSDVDTSTLKALYDGNLLANVVAGLPTVVFLIGFAFVALRHVSVPRWTGQVALFVAAIHLASAFALANSGAFSPSGLAFYVPPLAFTLWMAAVSVALLRTRVDEQAQM